MKGERKMTGIIILVIALSIGAGMAAAGLTMALASCSRALEGETGVHESVPSLPGTAPETEAPAPGEITRIRLVEGLTIRNVDMVIPERIEHILSMLDVDTYELVDPEHERAVAVLDEASVELEFYAGDELYGMAWVTNGCDVVVIIEGGGVWYTLTSKVDTVLITAEFGREDNE